MIAVVQIGGHQYTISEKSSLRVDRLPGAIGSTYETEALLISDEAGSAVKVGTPTVAGSKITFTIVDHSQDDKVRVFKMKSKKRYMRIMGFRAQKTELRIESIA